MRGRSTVFSSKATRQRTSRPTPGNSKRAPALPTSIDPSEVAKRILLLTQGEDYAIKGVAFGDTSWLALLNLFLTKAERQQVSVTELRNRLSIPTTSAQRLVHSLEANGHIRREQDSTDGRRFNLTLEQTAEAVLEKQLKLLNWPVTHS